MAGLEYLPYLEGRLPSKEGGFGSFLLFLLGFWLAGFSSEAKK